MRRRGEPYRPLHDPPIRPANLARPRPFGAPCPTIKIDDPVGATAVHLANGVFGTIAVGLFADPTVAPSAAVAKKGLFLGGGFEQLEPQLLVAVVAGAVFVLSYAFWLVTKLVSGGIRVSEEEEVDGLDLGEHGNLAYPDFQGAGVSSSTGHAPAAAVEKSPSLAGA